MLAGDLGFSTLQNVEIALEVLSLVMDLHTLVVLFSEDPQFPAFMFQFVNGIIELLDFAIAVQLCSMLSHLTVELMQVHELMDTGADGDMAPCMYSCCGAFVY